MADQADKILEKLRRGVSKAAAALVLQANKELRTAPPLGTPVQDGNARANWIPSAGAPAPGVPSSPASGNAAAAAGAAQVLAYQLGDGDLYLTNRTPYIRRLNDGWSKQSPALFVEAALERAKSHVQAMLGERGSIGGIGASAGQSARDIAGDMASNLAGAYDPHAG